MKQDSQLDKILKDVKSLTRPSDLQQYLRENVPYEDLLEPEFIAKLTQVNPAVKRVLEGALVDKEYDEAKQYEQEEDLETIEGIESYISRVDINVALAKHRDKVLKLARFYEEEGDYAKAQKYYNVIVEHGRNRKESFIQKYGQDDKDTIYYKARIGELACKSNVGQDLTDEEKDELADYLGKVASQEKPIDAFLTYFSPIPTAQLLNGNFDEIMKKGGTIRPRPRPGPKPSPEPGREYIAELAPDRRLKYIVDNYEITRAYTGMSAFEGSIVFEIADKNILIVEKFYEPMYEGETEPRPAYGSSTIVVNKDIELNIEEMTRGQLVELNQIGNKQIGRIYHKGESYYDRLDKTVERISGATKVQQSEQTENTFTSDLQSKGPIDTSDNQLTNEQPVNAEPSGKRTLEVVLKEMEQLDAAHEALETSLQEARKVLQKIDGLREKVAESRAKVQEAISGKMTEGIADTVLEQNKLITELNKEIKELEQSIENISIQECELEIAKNREERARLNEEVNKILGE